MRVLVTGAGGRVGRELVALLSNAGDEVVAFDARPLEGAPPGVRVVTGDLREERELAGVGHVDAVAHLAAFMSWLPGDAERLHEVNVNGTRRVLEFACGLAAPPRFVFASSGEVYPEVRPRYLPVDEHHPTAPTSAYGLTKLLGEELVRFHGRSRGLPFVIVRLPHTQAAEELLDPASFFSGPRFFLRSKVRRMEEMGDARGLAILRPLDDGRERLVLSRGENGTPYRMTICDARDVAAGLQLALRAQRAVGETIGLGPDEPVRFASLIPAMSEATGLPWVEARLPGPAVDYDTSNRAARELLGFRPRYPIERMLEEAAAAWRGRTLTGPADAPR